MVTRWKIWENEQEYMCKYQNNVPHLLPKKKTADGWLQYDSNFMNIKSLQDKQQGPTV